MLVKYNGVLLPSYPTDVDPAEYPYKFIRSRTDAYELLMSKTAFYYAQDIDGVGSDSASRYYSISKNQTLSDSSEWSYVNIVSAYPDNYYSLGSNAVHWSNEDILYKDSAQVYFAGLGEPVIPTHDYNSVEEIVTSAENATKIRNNSKNDDATDNVTGVDWFTYGGTVCSNIYANGNSWIGLGGQQEDLKVNRRDAAMWNLWREEGTIGAVRFIRIRWSGYTAYNSTSTSALLTYDVILFDTGDIQLYIVDIPTQYYNGVFALGNLAYTPPTVDNRWVAFRKIDSGYEVAYEPLSFVQYLTKYLIRNEGTLYTIVDGALSELTGELTADIFQTSGVDEIPDGALLMTLSVPEVLCWTNEDTVPVLTATVQGVPTGAHTVTSDHIQIDHPSIYGISSVVATASDGATFLLSFDGGAWMKYNDGTWSASDVGMTAAELMAIPSTAWSSVINSAQYMQLKATLEGVETVTQVVFNYNNEPPTS